MLLHIVKGNIIHLGRIPVHAHPNSSRKPSALPPLRDVRYRTHSNCQITRYSELVRTGIRVVET
ncbi:hypothetical protein BDW62DRAFT_196473 [Aspergillus aurantiobrunneus]